MMIVAVDWSGRARHDHRFIWTAVVEDGVLTRLERDRARVDVVDHLCDLAEQADRLVVGIDFAFSFPAWFAHRLGATAVEDVWAAVATQGGGWLDECEPPFWGRPGRKRPMDGDEEYRRTERDVGSVAGIRAKSVFQIGGAGAVGTGSLRGMPHLLRLRRAGFAIWPFDDGGGHTVVEIYPRLFTGPVVKSSRDARAAFLRETWPTLSLEMTARAELTEDAFDAAISALAMDHHRCDLCTLATARHDDDRLEGRIWYPDSPGRVDHWPVGVGELVRRGRPGPAADQHLLASGTDYGGCDATPLVRSEQEHHGRLRDRDRRIRDCCQGRGAGG